jgi:FixJ family two-component response regulator
LTLDLLRGALNQLETLKTTLEAALAKAEHTASGKPQVPAKHANGRLTDHGVRELRSMIDAGRLDAEIARALDITQPAVHNQRQKYMAERMTSKRRRKAA